MYLKNGKSVSEPKMLDAGHYKVGREVLEFKGPEIRDMNMVKRNSILGLVTLGVCSPEGACLLMPSLRDLFPEAFKVADSLNKTAQGILTAPEPKSKGAASKGQTWALYLLTGHDWRKHKNLRLTYRQASAMITAGNVMRKAA